jgi:hypothetical protein
MKVGLRSSTRNAKPPVSPPSVTRMPSAQPSGFSTSATLENDRFLMSMIASSGSGGVGYAVQPVAGASPPALVVLAAPESAPNVRLVVAGLRAWDEEVGS